MSLNCDKWENNSWQKDAFNHDEKVFDIFNQHLQTVWTNIRENIVPPIETEDSVPAVRYSLFYLIESKKKEMLDLLLLVP